MRRLGILAAILAAAGCSHVGTKITAESQSHGAVRAVDQQILADAVDSAFAGLQVPRVARPAPDTRPVTGYVHVFTVAPIRQELRDYVGAKAAAAAAAAGVQVREIKVIVERTPSQAERTWLEYPDTDVRVLVTVSHAGIDEVRGEGAPRSTDRSQEVLAGRFKATLAIVPRGADVQPFSKEISGEARFSLDEVRYFAGW